MLQQSDQLLLPKSMQQADEILEASQMEQLPSDMEPQGGSNYSPWVSVLNLCNAAIGSGVLSFPSAFRESGAVGGILLASLACSIEAGTLCLLVRVAARYNSKTYQQLVMSTLGPTMAAVTSLTMFTFLIGSMASYLIITGDVFETIFTNLFGKATFLADRRVVIMIFALFIILPLAMKRNLQDLKWSSTISVLMLTYLTIYLAVYGITRYFFSQHPSHVHFFQISFNTFIALDIVVFAFQSHVQVIPIFSELANDPHPFLKLTRRPVKEKLLEVGDASVLEMSTGKRILTMERAILLAMVICFIGYCLIGLFGYMAFPDVESDILKSLDDKNPFTHLARVGMAIVGMVCFPVQNHPARTILDDIVTHLRTAESNMFSWRRHIALTLALFAMPLGLALLVTDLGMVFSILGSTGCVLVIFIIPGFLLLLNANEHKRLPDSCQRPASQKYCGLKLVAGIFIILMGTLLFFVTCYVNIASSVF